MYIEWKEAGGKISYSVLGDRYGINKITAFKCVKRIKEELRENPDLLRNEQGA